MTICYNKTQGITSEPLDQDIMGIIEYYRREKLFFVKPKCSCSSARLERETVNLNVVGSNPYRGRNHK